MKNKSLLMFSSILLLSSVGTLTISACYPITNTSKTQLYAKTMVKGDSAKIQDILKENKIEVENLEDIYYKTTNSTIAKVLSNGLLLAINQGEANITCINSISDTIIFDFILKVKGYEEYNNIESYRNSKISVSGKLEDIMFNENLAKDTSNEFGISIPYLESQNISVISSNQDVLTYRFDKEKTKHYLEAHEIGNSILEIYDDNNDLIYREVVRVRRLMDNETEVRNFLTSVDYFIGEGWLDGNISFDGRDISSSVTKLSFPTENDGIYYGYSQEAGGDIGKSTFNFEFLSIGPYENTMRFELINFTSAVQFQYTISYLDVSMLGDALRLYSVNGLLEMYHPMSN